MYVTSHGLPVDFRNDRLYLVLEGHEILLASGKHYAKRQRQTCLRRAAKREVRDRVKEAIAPPF